MVRSKRENRQSAHGVTGLEMNSIKSKYALIFSRDYLIFEIVKNELEKMGCEFIVHATDRDDCLRMFDEFQIDTIFADVSDPNIDAPSMYRALSRIPGYSFEKMRHYLLGNSNDIALSSEMAGTACFISMPISSQQLAKRLEGDFLPKKVKSFAKIWTRDRREPTRGTLDYYKHTARSLLSDINRFSKVSAAPDKVVVDGARHLTCCFHEGGATELAHALDMEKPAMPLLKRYVRKFMSTRAKVAA